MHEVIERKLTTSGGELTTVSSGMSALIQNESVLPWAMVGITGVLLVTSWLSKIRVSINVSITK